MSEQITITLPTVNEQLVAHLTEETTAAVASEVKALAVLREKYARFAQTNGFIMVSYYLYHGNGSTLKETDYLRLDGKKVRAFKVHDRYETSYSDPNSGSYEGDRLYLTEHGEWIQTVREGNWSQWQGDSNRWNAYANTLTDAGVLEKFTLRQVIDGLTDALKTLDEKLNDRLVHVRERAQLAAKLLEALK